MNTQNPLVTQFAEVPGRFQAAMQVASWAQSITDPCRCCNPMVEGRPLSPREHAVYNAALAAMRLYLSGEVDMCGPSMTGEAAEAPTDPVTEPRVEPAVRIDGPDFDLDTNGS